MKCTMMDGSTNVNCTTRYKGCELQKVWR